MREKKPTDVSVAYEKFYIDDTGKHISSIFQKYGSVSVNVKNLWEGAIDAFYSMGCSNYFSCLHGDIRIVIAYDQGNNNYKFKQYYISGLDGKIIEIPPNVWFGVHNLSWGNGVLLNGQKGSYDDIERLSSKIFNWHAKR